MARIPRVDETAADRKTKDILAEARERWGSAWNITDTLAQNPPILQAFFAINRALDRSGLSEAERELICLEMACANGCHYCVPAHRYVSHQIGMDKNVVDTVARGGMLEGDGPEAVLQRLVRRLVASRGKLSDEEFRDFQDGGVPAAKMIAVVAEIAHCTLTNYFNRLAQTDLDSFLEPFRD